MDKIYIYLEPTYHFGCKLILDTEKLYKFCSHNECISSDVTYPPSQLFIEEQYLVLETSATKVLYG
jgi:hypothetical protein